MRISDWSSDVCSSDLPSSINAITFEVATAVAVYQDVLTGVQDGITKGGILDAINGIVRYLRAIDRVEDTLTAASLDDVIGDVRVVLLHHRATDSRSRDDTIRRVGICRCRFCTFSDDVANDVDIAAVLYLYAGVSEVPDCTTEDIDVLGTVIRVYSPGHISVTGISRSEENTSEHQSLMRISYAGFSLKKKKKKKIRQEEPSSTQNIKYHLRGNTRNDRRHNITNNKKPTHKKYKWSKSIKN